MDMDWEVERDDLGYNEPWVTDTYLAESVQKAVRDFRKWWNRYGAGVLNLYVGKPFVQLIMDYHSTK